MSIYPANVHRGLHTLSERATEAFEGVREKVGGLLGVEDSGQIVFTRGTTEAINLVAQSWGRATLKPGDAIVLSELEHHSNLVPWQILARELGVELKYVELTPDARLDLDALDAALTDRVRLVAVTGMSNVTGTMPPLDQIVAMARAGCPRACRRGSKLASSSLERGPAGGGFPGLLGPQDFRADGDWRALRQA